MDLRAPAVGTAPARPAETGLGTWRYAALCYTQGRQWRSTHPGHVWPFAHVELNSVAADQAIVAGLALIGTPVSAASGMRGVCGVQILRAYLPTNTAVDPEQMLLLEERGLLPDMRRYKPVPTPAGLDHLRSIAAGTLSESAEDADRRLPQVRAALRRHGLLEPDQNALTALARRTLGSEMRVSGEAS